MAIGLTIRTNNRVRPNLIGTLAAFTISVMVSFVPVSPYVDLIYVVIVATSTFAAFAIVGAIRNLLAQKYQAISVIILSVYAMVIAQMLYLRSMVR